MAQQSQRDRAEAKLKAGYGLEDIVADIHGDGGTLEERRATREWAAGIARDLRKAREHADLDRREF